VSWGNVAPATTAPPASVAGITYNEDYYRNRFLTVRAQSVPVRMSLVGRENTAKTGTALSMCDPNKKTVIFDVDNSAQATVEHIYGDNPNIVVIPLHDETDDSIFHDDNTVNYVALIDKVNWYINILAQEIAEKPDEYGAIIMDGMSSYLKWCEHAMTHWLMTRSKNPVNVEDGEKFNQAEWRVRNKIYRDTMSRVHGLPVERVFYTFHLKEEKQFADDGTGKKVLMTVGERPEWDKGTMRYFSQQLFLTRYTKKGDRAAGVKVDKNLSDNEWVIKASIEEMKGKNMEHLGTTHTILSVKDGNVKWAGLPFLKWGDESVVNNEN
tara:strand:+ start:1376 stop:2347 length:972 start_codon:yes stop_codon:yes gene_type:complete